MSDQPNVTVVYQYPQPKDKGSDAIVWVISVVITFIIIVSLACNGLAYLLR